MQAFTIFLNKLLESGLSVIKVLILSRFRTIKKFRVKKNALILANGPSLADFIEKHSGSFREFDLWAMNHFAETDQFNSFQPGHFVLIDPMLWLKEVDEKYQTKRAKLIKALVDNTKWQMILHLPYKAKSSASFLTHFENHQFIELSFFNDTPVGGFPVIRHAFYKLNLGMPRPNNVLIPSIFLCINERYKRILLSGVDHSWFPHIRVDENNNVLVNEKHFYDEKTSTESTMHKRGKGKMSLTRLLQQYMNVFRSYEYLERYSRGNSVEILNLTVNSYVDAFKKVDFSDFKTK